MCAVPVSERMRQGRRSRKAKREGKGKKSEMDRIGGGYKKGGVLSKGEEAEGGSVFWVGTYLL